MLLLQNIYRRPEEYLDMITLPAVSGQFPLCKESTRLASYSSTASSGWSCTTRNHNYVSLLYTWMVHATST